MTQEELMRALDQLDLKELRQIQGCGVPGDAWRHCNECIRKKEAEIGLFIAQGGVQASATTEHETLEEENPDGAPRV
jgi:hypothetical protein